MHLTKAELTAAAHEAAQSMSPNELFERLGVYKEAERNLKEIPQLIEWVEYKFPRPIEEFEKRLEEYGRGQLKLL